VKAVQINRTQVIGALLLAAIVLLVLLVLLAMLLRFWKFSG
jgi:hypothetical protein